MLAIDTICTIHDTAKTNSIRAESILRDHYTQVLPMTRRHTDALYELTATSNMLAKYLEETFDMSQADQRVEVSSSELLAITQLMKLTEEVKKSIDSISFVTQ